MISAQRSTRRESLHLPAAHSACPRRALAPAGPFLCSGGTRPLSRSPDSQQPPRLEFRTPAGRVHESRMLARLLGHGQPPAGWSCIALAQHFLVHALNVLGGTSDPGSGAAVRMLDAVGGRLRVLSAGIDLRSRSELANDCLRSGLQHLLDLAPPRGQAPRHSPFHLARARPRPRRAAPRVSHFWRALHSSTASSTPRRPRSSPT